MKIFPLSKLLIGENAYIYKLDINDAMKKRLSEFGFFPGNIVSKAFNSPFGGLNAYKIFESIIALRDETAENILVKADKEVYS